MTATARVIQYREQSAYTTLSSSQRACKILAGDIFADKRPWKHVAADIGVCPQTLSRIAYGDTKRPHFETLRRIADYYGYEIVLVKK